MKKKNKITKKKQQFLTKTKVLNRIFPGLVLEGQYGRNSSVAGIIVIWQNKENIINGKVWIAFGSKEKDSAISGWPLCAPS